MTLSRAGLLLLVFIFLLHARSSHQYVKIPIIRAPHIPGVYCCEINETKLWKQAVRGLTPQLSYSLQSLFDYNFLLPNTRLKAGLSYYGAASRLRRLVSDLLDGKRTFRVGVVGGSISWGLTPKRRGKDDWFPIVTQYLRSATKATISARNGCLPGTPSSFMELCLQHYIDSDVDLIFVEYSYNDGEENRLVDNGVVMTLERLLRRLLDLPNSPAVVLMQVPHVLQSKYEPFYATSEDLEGALASYYDIPVLSSRTALWQLAVLYPEPGWEWGAVYHSHHPGNPGHKAMADLAVHLIQKVALDLTVRPMTEEERRGPGAGALPPPMFPDNLPPSTPQCIIGSDFTGLVAAAQGFEWVNEGTAEKPKWGYVATSPGSSLTVRLNTTSSRLHNATATVEVLFHYLQSYTPMGMAAIECVAGCTCGRTLVDAYNPRDPSSQTHAVGMSVGQAPRCDIRVTVMEATQSGGHKFKVSGVVISDLGKARSRGDYKYWAGGLD